MGQVTFNIDQAMVTTQNVDIDRAKSLKRCQIER